MELWLAGLVILAAAGLSVAGMLIARRRAPGSFFKDPIPMAAVYTVVGTAYMLIVAFVFFVAFESYSGAKSDAEEEATATLAMFHAALPFSTTERARLCARARRATPSTHESGRWKKVHPGSRSKAKSNSRRTSTGSP
jgi:hypothetical protein